MTSKKRPDLFGDVHTQWRLGKRVPTIVSRDDVKCLRIRILWTPSLGLELDYDLYSYAKAREVVDRIKAHGLIEVSRWRRVFFPSPTWSK